MPPWWKWYYYLDPGEILSNNMLKRSPTITNVTPSAGRLCDCMTGSVRSLLHSGSIGGVVASTANLTLLASAASHESIVCLSAQLLGCWQGR